MNTRTRIFLFESTQMACDLLSSALEHSEYGLRVLGIGTSAEKAELLAVAEADVALISTRLEEGPRSGLSLLRRLRSKVPKVRCVMLLDCPDAELLVEAFASGAVGVCDRSQPHEMVCKCLDSVNRGHVWANSEQLHRILTALVERTPDYRWLDKKGNVTLSKKEDAIVTLVTQGLKNREIANVLGISEHTVKNRLLHIFEKLGVSTRTELTLVMASQTSSRLIGA